MLSRTAVQGRLRGRDVEVVAGRVGWGGGGGGAGGGVSHREDKGVNVSCCARHDPLGQRNVSGMSAIPTTPSLPIVLKLLTATD